MSSYRPPLALNLLGGYLAEEGCPLVFVPLEPGPAVEIEEGDKVSIEGLAVVPDRLRKLAMALAREAGAEGLVVRVKTPPRGVPELSLESAVLASLFEYFEQDEEDVVLFVERVAGEGERGVLAGGIVASLLRAPIAYRLGEGFVELEQGFEEFHVLLALEEMYTPLGEALSKVRYLKEEYGRVFEPLFHAFCRLAIEVAECLRSGDLGELRLMLSIAHRILSSSGLSDPELDRLVLELEERGLAAKAAEYEQRGVLAVSGDGRELQRARLSESVETCTLKWRRGGA